MPTNEIGTSSQAILNKIKEIDFATTEITMEQYREIRYWQFSGWNYGVVQSSTIIGGKTLEYNRYPKKDQEGNNTYVYIGGLINDGESGAGLGPNDQDNIEGKHPVFEYLDVEIESWSNYGDIWMYGY